MSKFAALNRFLRKRRRVGPSAVSQAILKDYGAILSRRERKKQARERGVAFKAYYNV